MNRHFVLVVRADYLLKQYLLSMALFASDLNSSK